jgi:hypothetical protein
MVSRYRLATVVTLIVAFSACNGVLGIEQATLDDTATGDELATCERTARADPDLECIPATSACEDCLASSCSAGLVTECVGDARCRQTLVNYRLCIWEDCRDEGGDCGGCVGGSPLADELGRCIRGCSAECDGSGIASLCEIYCKCMEQNCGPDWVSSCEADCMARPTWKTHCWWEHCERATSPSSQHCGHATTRDDACGTKRGPAEVCDYPLKWDSSPCDDGAECCSTVCNAAGICIP